jgi:hypothetical protein
MYVGGGNRKGRRQNREWEWQNTEWQPTPYCLNKWYIFKTFDASYVLTNKVVAKYVGGQTQGLQDLCLGTQGACF